MDFILKGADGRNYSLQDFKEKNGLLLVFTCNHCPYAKAAWPTLISLHGKFGESVAFTAINSNDGEKYPEDSYEAMRKKIEEWGIPFPYLWDGSQEYAKIYRAQCTPDNYLFENEDGIFKLYYHGRIADDWEKPALAKEKNLENALERLIKDEPAPENQPQSVGCSIKWKT